MVVGGKGFDEPTPSEVAAVTPKFGAASLAVVNRTYWEPTDTPVSTTAAPLTI